MSRQYYLDSSVLVKKYITESGTPYITNLFSGNFLFYTSCIAYPEVYSVFNRLGRTGFLSSDKKSNLLEDFEKDWASIIVIDYGEDVHEAIPGIAERFFLSGGDSIHLACAAVLKSQGLDPAFLTSDLRLLNAASEYGFDAVNPAEK
ncbi:MAG: type II toxin-antitoxin system VapC family toxin [Deltaproteobacteria bacterium]|nr:type II toxin-antitoxin system VapC family toxin [Deltaproteobacteria bacterium]